VTAVPSFARQEAHLTSRKRSAPRSPNALSEAWEIRTQQVKAETAAASAANDAKSARLKALRLEKEREEALTAPKNDKAAAPKKPRMKRFVVK
jgi:hypothetical protein